MQSERRLGEELLRVLRDAMERDTDRMSWAVTLYTSFGIVHAHIRRVIAESASLPVSSPSSDTHTWTAAVIEVEDAEVEHYDSHLSCASYRTLLVKVDDIRGFAFADPARSNFV